MKQFQSFRLDTSDECLWREGQRLTLTRKAICRGMLFYAAKIKIEKEGVDIGYVRLEPIKLMNLRKY